MEKNSILKNKSKGNDFKNRNYDNKRGNNMNNGFNGNRGAGRQRNSSGRNYDRRNDFTRETISSFEKAKNGDYFHGVVKIVRKAKPGPVVFAVSDGYLQLDAVTPTSSFELGEVVELRGKINERAGALQIEIDSMDKSIENFDNVLYEKSKPFDKEASIDSDRMRIMKGRMLEIAHRLRRAVLDGEAIMIRHHADTDGISAGLALEHSLEALMKKTGVNPQYYLYRSPSKAPFYEVSDMLRDFTTVKRIENDFGQKKPIFVVVDNGSTPEDLFAHKTLHGLGYEIIVIDHHNPVVLEKGKTAVCDYLTLHLNPYLFGLDSQTSAGMICYEIARLIDKDYDEPLIPAVTGISDHCLIPETDMYIKNTGKTREELADIGIAVDFASYNMKFQSGEGLYEELYKNPEMVSMMTEKVSKGVETQLQSTLPYIRTQEIKGIIFSYIDIEKYTMRYTYPNPGKVVSLIHDKMEEGKGQHAVLTLGCLSDMIIFRANKPVFPVAEVIALLQKKIPQANVDGGGHECAGAIKFVGAHFDEILQTIKDHLSSLPEFVEEDIKMM